MASSASELNSKKCLLKIRYNGYYAKTADIIGVVTVPQVNWKPAFGIMRVLVIYKSFNKMKIHLNISLNNPCKKLG